MQPASKFVSIEISAVMVFFLFIFFFFQNKSFSSETKYLLKWENNVVVIGAVVMWY